ncbi:MAG: T9SS type A sorting domain-containing protein [Saprospiraceae bacterium]
MLFIRALLLAVLLHSAFAAPIAEAQCPAGDVELLTQADVNAFVSAYPTCTTINGYLQIGDFFTDITNLSGLSALTSVVGSLIVQGNPDLPNLNGLHNIATVGDELVIVYNDMLVDMSGLTGLTTVSNLIIIEGNSALENLAGLDQLAAAGGIAVADNPALTSLDGIETLLSAASIVLVNNALLADLTGIAQLDPTLISNVRIEDNPSLSACSVVSICDYLQAMGSHTIANNDTGCNSGAEVLAACAAMPVEWLSWQVSRTPEGIRLEWSTGVERDNRGFGIERSGDGLSWSEIGFLDGHGSHSRYAWIDRSPLRGLNYYRLRQSDFDGALAYSPIRLVWTPPALRAPAPYPNPARGRVTAGERSLNFALYDAQGVLRLQGATPTGQIDLKGLPAGLYRLQVTDTDATRVFPLLVVD